MVATYYGDPGVYVFLDPESAGSGLVHLYHLGRIVAHPEDCSVALDLTDATGRAHAAWWVAEALGMTAPAYLSWIDRGEWWLCGGGIRRFGVMQVQTPIGPLFDLLVPGLADLDPNDPRTLPDGSRWVDAEALRLVCLHLKAADER